MLAMRSRAPRSDLVPLHALTVSYSALASPKSALAFQSLSCLPCVSYSFLVSAMYLP